MKKKIAFILILLSSLVLMAQTVNIRARYYNNIRQCDQFSGININAKVIACLADLPSTGGTADARSIEGIQTLGSLTITKPTTLLLGAGTYTGTITISGSSANGTIIKGIGRNITTITEANAGNDALKIIGASVVRISDLSLRSVSNTGNSVVVLIQSAGGNANNNSISNVQIVGPGQGAASTTNTSKCIQFDTSGGGNTYFNEIRGNYLQLCNTLISMDGNSNANYITNNTLGGYWKALSIAGIENIVKGNFVSGANGASVNDPTVALYLTGNPLFNDLEIPTGEPGTNTQAISTSFNSVVNYIRNPCTLNYDIGLTQVSGSFSNAGSANPGLDQPTCNNWTYTYDGLKENRTYELSNFGITGSYTSTDVILQYDSFNAATSCISAGLVHAYIQNAGGTVTVKPVDITEQNNAAGGCASFSGWEIVSTTISPVFFNTNNGTSSTATRTHITVWTSVQAGNFGRSLTDLGAGNVAPTTRVSGNVATAQSKGHLSVTSAWNPMWAGNDCQGVAISLTGVTDGDVTTFGLPNTLANAADMVFYSYSFTNFVNIRGCKLTAGAYAPGSQNVRVDVWKY